MKNNHFRTEYTVSINIPKYIFGILKLLKKFKFLLKLKTFEFYNVIIKLPVNSKVLDVGCGDGIKLKIINYLRPDLKLYGVDLSDKTKFLSKNIIFKIIDGEKLDFKDNFFDLVINFHVIEHVLDAQILVDEFERITKKNGKIFIEVPHANTVFFPGELNFFHDPTHYRPFTCKSLKKLFDVNGKIETISLNSFRFGKLNLISYILLFPILIFIEKPLKYIYNLFFHTHIVYIGEKK